MSSDNAQDQARFSKKETEFQELIKRVQAGDQDAATYLYERYSPYLLKIIRRRFLEPDSILRRAMDSDDFLQETFCSTFQGIIQGGQFTSKEAFINWMLTIAERRSQEVYRFNVTAKKRSLDRVEALDADKHSVEASEPDPAHAVEAQDESQCFLDRIPQHHRELLLPLGDKAEIAEVAERLGIKARHAERMYRRIRREYAAQFFGRT